MKNSKTPKIVVAIGLAAVYATGLAALMPHGEKESVVVQSAPVTPSAQAAIEPDPAPVVPATADIATTNPVEAPALRRVSQVSSRANEQIVANVATASLMKESVVEEASGDGNSSARDSVNSADARSEVAVVVPDGNADVTTDSAELEPAAAETSEQ